MATLYILWPVAVPTKQIDRHLTSTTYTFTLSCNCKVSKTISFILFNEFKRFLGEIETDNLTVSNSEITTFDFTVSKQKRTFVK